MSLIFVSHAAADQQIANLFRERLRADFLNMCEIFVSSNLDSLQAGVEWQHAIKENLQKSSILVGLLSPRALQRGWVYAEFGAGWIRDIPTIPLCHSGLDRGQLPPPISSFQGLNIEQTEHLQHLYKVIGNAIGCAVPQIDFSARTNEFAVLSQSIALQSIILNWGRQLEQWNNGLHERLKAVGKDEDVLVPANLDQAFMEFVEEAAKREFIVVERRGMGMGTKVGPQASIFSFSQGPKFDEYLKLMEEPS